MRKCVCERVKRMKCVCVPGEGRGGGAGFSERSLLLPINCHSGFAIVSQHNPAKKNTDDETAAELFFNDFANPVRFTRHVAKPYMVRSYLLVLLNQVIHKLAGSLQSLMEYLKLFVSSFALFCLMKRQILCCTNFHFLPFTFCLSLCSGACMTCHNRVVLAIFFAC